MICAELDLLADRPPDLLDRVRAPPATRARAKPSRAKTPEHHAFPPPAPIPAWARASGRAGEGDPLFAAGAGLALLDAFLRRDPPSAGALRARLALQSAAASAKILRLNADEGALRDLRFAVGEAPGSAANLLTLWRDLAGRPPSLDPGRILDAAARLDLALPDPNGLASSLKACAGQGDPVSAAAKAAALAFSAFPDAPAAEAEIFSLWVFDITLALRLRWARPVPLIATKILDPASAVGRGRTAEARRPSLVEGRRRRDRAGRRLRPRPRRRSLPPRRDPHRRRAQTTRRNRRPKSSTCYWPRIASRPPKPPATRR